MDVVRFLARDAPNAHGHRGYAEIPHPPHDGRVAQLGPLIGIAEIEVGVELEHGETRVALAQRGHRRQRERVLTAQRERDLPFGGHLVHHRLQFSHPRLEVGRLHFDLGQRRDADLERLAIQLLVVELDLTGGLEDGLGAEAGPGEVARRLVEGRGDHNDPRLGEIRIRRAEP